MSTPAPQASPSTETLDYDELFSSYQRGLVETLRGFGPAQSYLSLWVPDEVPWKGIWNLFDAAASESQKELRVRVRETLELNVDTLQHHLSCFGTPVIERRGEYLILEILDLRPARAEQAKKLLNQSPQRAPLSANHAPSRQGNWQSPTKLSQCPYREGMKEASLHCSHESPAPANQATQASKTLLIQTHGALGTLWIELDQAEQRVLACGHQGATHFEAKGCLDLFCRLAIGRPIRDVLDHGAERTEFGLRKNRAKRPVAGIVLPNNAHPVFGELQATLAALRSQCQAFEESWSQAYNEYDSGAGPTWNALSDEARSDKINALLLDFKARHADQVEALSLVRLLGGVRVHASLLSSATSEQKAVLVSRLEEELRDHLEPRLELFLEQKKDQNKLRRLSVIQPTKSK